MFFAFTALKGFFLILFVIYIAELMNKKYPFRIEIPSFLNPIFSFPRFENFPTVGEVGGIYVAELERKIYCYYPGQYKYIDPQETPTITVSLEETPWTPK